MPSAWAAWAAWGTPILAWDPNFQSKNASPPKKNPLPGTFIFVQKVPFLTNDQGNRFRAPILYPNFSQNHIASEVFRQYIALFRLAEPTFRHWKPTYTLYICYKSASSQAGIALLVSKNLSIRYIYAIKVPPARRETLYIRHIWPINCTSGS